MATYKIHPAIGVARLGDSRDSFYIAPETPAALPYECDAYGNLLLEADGSGPVPIKTFRDKEGRIRRQAARFQLFVYDDKASCGRALKLGDAIEGGGNHGVLVDVQWRVWLANKKACWREFDARKGEHGYAPDHPRRNADVTGDGRDRLTIDPGPRCVDATKKRRASFDRSGDGVYAATFPPEDLSPSPIDTLGDLLTDDSGRLLVLGGHGASGCYKKGPQDPRITTYANNDGWFDDISDGPVMARLVMYCKEVGQTRYVDVDYPAWVIVGYPRYAPQLLDMITLDEVVYDLSLRQFAADTAIYGRAQSFACPETVNAKNKTELDHWLAGRLTFNPDLRPWFYRDIWPILFRPNEFNFVSNILAQSNFPHDPEHRGMFDPDILSKTPERFGSRKKAENAATQFLEAQGQKLRGPDRLTRRDGDAWVCDPHESSRRFLFDMLRRRGEENEFKLVDRVDSRVHNLPLMPLLCGDNPLTNDVPTKFLALTDYQLFILSQWAAGKFVNEIEEGWLDPETYYPYLPYPSALPDTGHGLDRGVLSNVLGGAFCPGAELGWVMRNPSIYHEPYRVKAEPIRARFALTAAEASKSNSSQSDDAFNIGSPLSQDNDFDAGLEPGDLTKYMSLPWQSDFNECTTQSIDITYPEWNVIGADGSDSRLRDAEKMWTTLWWPAHRPLQTNEIAGYAPDGSLQFEVRDWSRGIQQTSAGDLAMVSEWRRLGFLIRNPSFKKEAFKQAPQLDAQPRYYSIERDDGDFS